MFSATVALDAEPSTCMTKKKMRANTTRDEFIDICIDDDRVGLTETCKTGLPLVGLDHWLCKPQ